ncbi:uncharacterized protein LOC143933493 [Lithobates pipiens]
MEGALERDWVPPTYQAEPPLCQAEPSPYQAEPSPCQAEPSLCQAEPSPCQAEPPPYQAEPSPYQAEPSPYQAEPSPCQAEPSPCQAEPSLCQAEPSPCQAEPSPCQAEPSLCQAEPSLCQAEPPPYQAEPSLYQAEPPPYQAEPPPYESLPLPSPPSFSTAISEAHTESLSYFSSVLTPTGQDPDYPLSNLQRGTGDPPPGYFQPYWITAELPQPRAPSPGPATEHTGSRCQQLTRLEFFQVETQNPSPGSLVGETSLPSLNQNSQTVSARRSVKPNSCLLWSIICLFCFPPLGCVSIIFSITVKLYNRRRNFDKAEKYSGFATLLNCISLVAGLIIFIILLVLYILYRQFK